MSLRTATFGLMLATAVLSFTSFSAQAADPLAGTWGLNVARSKSAVALPTSQTRTHSRRGTCGPVCDGFPACPFTSF